MWYSSITGALTARLAGRSCPRRPFSTPSWLIGLLVLGSHRQIGTPQEVKSVAASLGANFPISIQTIVRGSEDVLTLPHSLLFDHTGVCIFRGSPADVEPLIRIALGKALVDAAGRDKFSSALSPIVADLKKAGRRHRCCPGWPLYRPRSATLERMPRRCWPR